MLVQSIMLIAILIIEKHPYLYAINLFSALIIFSKNDLNTG
jgi:hypothetical protein